MRAGSCRWLGWLLLPVSLGLLLPAGCSDCPRHAKTCRDSQYDRMSAAPERPVLLAAAGPAYAPGLLFDRMPPRVPAAAFANRSDWPSTRSFYSTGQQVFYSEHFMDYQGPLFPNQPWDNTYLYLDSVRVGSGFR